MATPVEIKNEKIKAVKDYYGRAPEKGDLFPLIPKTEMSPDVSHVVKELFQEYLKEEVPSYETAKNMQITCEKNGRLKLYADSVVNLYERHHKVLNEIASIEEEMMKNHTRYLLKKDVIHENKNINNTLNVKGLPIFRPIDENIAKNYPLIKSSDVFEDDSDKFGFQNPETRTVANYMTSSKISVTSEIRNLVPKEKMLTEIEQKEHPKPIRHKIKKNYITSKDEHDKLKATDISVGKNNLVIVKPTNIEFTSYECGGTYQKVLLVQNAGSRKIRVHILPLNKKSKFRVKDMEEGAIVALAPGISVAIKIKFCCTSLDNASDEFVLKVEGGKEVFVPISAHRIAPVLEAPGPTGLGDLKPKSNQEQAGTTLECGVVLVGESVLKLLHLSNDGGEGSFWIMSEEEWTHCESKCGNMNNILNIPPFSLKPFYFHLKPMEEITICLFYRSESQGLQVKHIKILCDNCMVHDLDILADAVYFESRFISFAGLKKTCPIEMDDDVFADYYFNMGNILPNGSSQKMFYLTNESDIDFQFRWRTRDIDLQDCSNNNFHNLLPEWVSISPSEGIFLKKSEQLFTLKISLENSQIGQYRVILSLYVEKLPWQSVIRASKVRGVAVNPKAINRVDVLVNEIEVWAECVPIVVMLQPHIIKLTSGKLRCNEEPILPKLTMTNATVDNIAFSGILVSPPLSEPAAINQIDVQVIYGSVNAKTFLPCPLKVTTLSHGLLLHEIRCSLNEGEKSVEMLVCAQVIEPQIYLSKYILNFGNIKKFTQISLPLKIYNGSYTEVVWVAREFRYNFSNDTLQYLSECNLSVIGGCLCYRDSVCTVHYTLDTKKSGLWMSIVEFSVATFSRRLRQHFLLIIGDIQEPQMSINVPPLFTALLCPQNPLFLGIPVTTNVILRNHSSIPLTFKWGIPMGADLNKLKFHVKPRIGVIQPTKNSIVRIVIIPMEMGKVSSFFVPCFLEKDENPIILSIKCKVKGVNITFIIPLNSSQTKYDVKESGKCIPWSIDDKMIFPSISLSKSFADLSYYVSERRVNPGKDASQSAPVSAESKFKHEGSRELLIQKIDYDVNNSDYLDQIYNTFPFQCESIDVSEFLENELSGKLYLGIDNRLILHLPLVKTSEFAPVRSLETEINASINNMENDPEWNKIPLHTFPLANSIDQSDVDVIDGLQKCLYQEGDWDNSFPYSADELCMKNSGLECDPEFGEIPMLGLPPFLDHEKLSSEEKELKIKKFLPNIQIVSEIILKEIKVKEVASTNIFIRNETPIETFYEVKANNFPPKTHIKVRNFVGSWLQDISCQERGKMECCLKSNCGIVVFIKQSSKILKPYATAPVEIFIYANTWGNYCETIVCHVNGLPPFYVRLIMEVQGPPVYFCISPPNITSHVPVRFGPVRYLSKCQTRNLSLYNESCVTVNIAWHIFMKDYAHKSSKAESLTVNMCSVMKRKEFYCQGPDENVCKRCEKQNENKSDCPEIMDLNVTYFGVEDYTFFQVTPKETIIHPKTTEIVQVSFNPLMVITEHEITQICAHLVGFMRVSTSDIRSKNRFYRPYGKNLLPIIQNICAEVEIPYFSLELENNEFEFKVGAGFVLNQPQKQHHITHVIVVKNKFKSSITAVVNTEKPFSVTHVKTRQHRQRKSKVYTSDIVFTLLPGECAEVFLLCEITEDLILKIHKTFYNATKENYSHDEIDRFCQKTALIERSFNLTQPSIMIQTFKLKLIIEYPLLTVSREKINFGPVFVGGTQHTTLEVENKTESCVWFNITKVYQTNEFSIKPSCGVLPPISVYGRSILQIKVNFSPTEDMSYLEYLKIRTFFPGDEKIVVLDGCGTIDSKFHTSG